MLESSLSSWPRCCSNLNILSCCCGEFSVDWHGPRELCLLAKLFNLLSILANKFTLHLSLGKASDLLGKASTAIINIEALAFGQRPPRSRHELNNLQHLKQNSLKIFAIFARFPRMRKNKNKQYFAVKKRENSNETHLSRSSRTPCGSSTFGSAPELDIRPKNLLGVVQTAWSAERFKEQNGRPCSYRRTDGASKLERIWKSA